LIGGKIPVSKKAFLLPALLIGVTWLWFSVMQPENAIAGPIPGALPGSQAPDFTLQTLDGEMVTLSELQGRPVLVNMWASWCTPCKYEMPTIQKMYEEFRDRGLVVLAVNLASKDNLSSVTSFVEEYGLTFPILLDLDGKVEEAYLLRGLPTTFFIDRYGIIQAVVIGGPMSEEVLRTHLGELIDGP
jgi:peroxiredoxin